MATALELFSILGSENREEGNEIGLGLGSLHGLRRIRSGPIRIGEVSTFILNVLFTILLQYVSKRYQRRIGIGYGIRHGHELQTTYPCNKSKIEENPRRNKAIMVER